MSTNPRSKKKFIVDIHQRGLTRPVKYKIKRFRKSFAIKQNPF